MRLAFDKPTIIIKDSQTPFTFDTSSIEHLEYPRDLRFSKITEFKDTLISKIKATYNKSTSDPNYTTFLKHFGEFTVAKLDKKEVPGQEFILDELRSMRRSINRMERYPSKDERSSRNLRMDQGDVNICFSKSSENDLAEALAVANSIHGVSHAFASEVGGHKHLIVYMDAGQEDQIPLIESKLSKYSRVRRRSNGGQSSAAN